MSSTQRVDIPYKFAIGLAFKNKEELLVNDIYNFIMVHMPKIMKDIYWKSAVRNNLMIHSCFKKEITKQEDGKCLSYYKFVDEAAKEDFDKEYPVEFGLQYDFMANPENYTKMYNGELGYPTDGEIHTARAIIENEKAKKEEINDEKFISERMEKIKDVYDEGKEICLWRMAADGTERCVKVIVPHKNKEYLGNIEAAEILKICETQIPAHDCGSQKSTSRVGPIRSETSRNSSVRMAPYRQPNVVLPEQPVIEPFSQMPSLSFISESEDMEPRID